MSLTKQLNTYFDRKVIKGIVTEIDKGQLMTSVSVQSGKRILTAVIPNTELYASGMQLNREVFCIMQGEKDVIFVSDIKEYLNALMEKNNGHMDTVLIK